MSQTIRHARRFEVAIASERLPDYRSIAAFDASRCSGFFLELQAICHIYR
jgi:hypothetical protein